MVDLVSATLEDLVMSVQTALLVAVLIPVIFFFLILIASQFTGGSNNSYDETQLASQLWNLRYTALKNLGEALSNVPSGSEEEKRLLVSIDELDPDQKGFSTIISQSAGHPTRRREIEQLLQTRIVASVQRATTYALAKDRQLRNKV